MSPNETEPANDAPSRGRPRGSTNKPKPAKRQYAQELSAVQAAVKMALRILNPILEDDTLLSKDRVRIAVEILEGE